MANGTLKRYNGVSWDSLFITPASHAHAISEVVGLQGTLNGKIGDAPSDGKSYVRKDAAWAEAAASVHNHVEADITDLDKYSQAIVDGKLSLKADVHGHPFASEDHTHTGVYASENHNHDAEYQVVGSYAALNHNHNTDYKDIGYVPSWGEITGKPSTFNTAPHNHDGDYPAIGHNHDGVYEPVHSHPYASNTHNHDSDYKDIGYVPSWGEITGKPSTFTPSTHNHDTLYPTKTGTNLGKTGSIALTTYSSAADYANSPVGKMVMLHSSSVGMPSWFSSYSYFIRGASRDSSGGYSGIAIDYNTGEIVGGKASTSNDLLTWQRMSTDHAHPYLLNTTTVTDLGGKTSAQITAEITAAVNAVIDGAPGAIDTLNELAAALGDDPNFATTITNLIATKAPLSHTHSEYLKYNPDGDGVVISYSDANPTIDGQAVGGGHWFGADGSATNGFLAAKVLIGQVLHGDTGVYVGTMDPATGGTGVKVADAAGKLFYTGTDTDARYLGISAKATDADKLDGLDSSVYMRDDGWNTSPGQDADLQPNMKTDFTYANNAPHTGPLTKMGAGEYALQLNSAYSGGGSMAFRTKNGDNGTWNGWHDLWHDGNFDPTTKADVHSHPYIENSGSWRGTHTDKTRVGGISNGGGEVWFGFVGGKGHVIADGEFWANEGTNQLWHNANKPSLATLGAAASDHTHDYTGDFLGKTAKAADSEKVDGINGASLLRSDADDTFSGALVSSARDKGIFGTYDSYKTDQIWSMGTSYKNASDGSNFGNLYGLAYKHTNNPTGGTMAGGHQMVWVINGTPQAAMGDSGMWTESHGTSANWKAGYDHSQAAHAPSDANNYNLRDETDWDANAMQVMISTGDGGIEWAPRSFFALGSHTHSGMVDSVADLNTLLNTTTTVRFGRTSSNQGYIEMVPGTGGNPAIKMGENGDAGWTLGVDDGDNSLKFHGAAGAAPNHAITTPHWELTTSGYMYIRGTRLEPISSSTLFGGLKSRISGSTLYLRNDASSA